MTAFPGEHTNKTHSAMKHVPEQRQLSKAWHPAVPRLICRG